ncbi:MULTISPECIES: Pr6Pr family membrane protein [Pseudonocardia]|uniref:FAR-17a/AIG1-like protein n=2 Tax=Pseudonocardia TaxID=1847 RepID=A0A1Y2N7J6_PSEAH|nr:MULTISPECIES: Pr6Pr family membrane protein [Pseudonocardia]OSY42878.1 hypothetical protein BG845_01120 [Pseudonocardia autotrophica]TDN77456.1 hypothetical protein C8E95_6702 [Pseudonocardia autotrophica]BBG01478.1 hypothetical protein Pdca_26870 [Pseudonocardia autotrophica]GEC25262.1 hypothetical protein PSA01_22910 [Pseudonocardia saturnea]
MTVRPRPPVAVLLRAAIVLCVVAALVAVELNSRSGVAWRLTTFTYQANVLAAVVYGATLLTRRFDARPALRGAVVVYLLGAGLVWLVFLIDRSTGFTPANVLLHLVVPALALADWLLTGRDRPGPRWWHPPLWLLYPAAYLAFAQLLLDGAPYYFLDVRMLGYTGLVRNVVALAGGFLVLGWLVVALGPRGQDDRKRSISAAKGSGSSSSSR